MSDAKALVTQQLPYLRRFARACLKDQQTGDAAVRACLEQVLLGIALEPEPGAAKLTLFTVLADEVALRMGSGSEARAGDRPIDDQAILAARMGVLNPLHRRLMLLTTLEGMSLGDAARVLRLAPADAADLLAEAKRLLLLQPATRILIIEDEPVIALDIAQSVQRNGHHVVGVATTHAEAVQLARRERPGLVLADIQLADRSSGLAAVQEILREINLPVIFITAYPERLLTGERPEPTFLITKPFDTDTLAVSIAQALSGAGQARG